VIEEPAVILVIEMQVDLVGQPGSSTISRKLSEAVARRGCIPKLAQVLQSCRRASIPVVYCLKERLPDAALPDTAPIYKLAGDAILVRGTEGARVVDELAPEPEDIVVSRLTSIDPSHGSDLWGVLDSMGARTLIVAGVSTTFAVEGTVRAAVNRGYRVLVLEDCCAGVPDEWHDFSVRNVMPLLAEVTTSAVLDIPSQKSVK
jgi:biuret amidohydrolase